MAFCYYYALSKLYCIMLATLSANKQKAKELRSQEVSYVLVGHMLK